MKFVIVGTAHTCFKEKFGIPRQAGLVPSSKGVIKLCSPFDREEALRGLDTFTHIYISFVPHLNSEKTTLSVRPPRLGGNEKIGVFATRSPFRPNPICHSIVQLDSVNFNKGEVHFSNHDILDQSPILDIRPYIPQWDIFKHASNGWIQRNNDVAQLEVVFTEDFQLEHGLELLIREILTLNPRPRYKKDKTHYALKIRDKDIHFKYLPHDVIEVYRIEDL